MTFKTRELTVDLINEVSTNEIRFSQGDENSAKLVLNITNQGQELDLSKATAVRITFEKSDRKIVFQQDCQVINAMKGKYQIVLKTQTLAAIGNVYGQVQIIEGDQKIDSQVFVFTVKRSLSSNEAVESKNEFTIIQRALEVGEQFKGVDFAPIIAAGALAQGALPKAGGKMTGNIEFDASTTEKRLFHKGAVEHFGYLFNSKTTGIYNWRVDKFGISYNAETDTFTVGAANTNLYKKTDLYAGWLTPTGVTNSMAPGTDLNSLRVAGIYGGNGFLNAPNGDSSSYYVEVIQYGDAAYTLQIATTVSNSNNSGVWVRRRAGGIWSAWEKLIDSKGGTIAGTTQVNAPFRVSSTDGTKSVNMEMDSNGKFWMGQQLPTARNVLTIDPDGTFNVIGATNLVKKAGDTMTGSLYMDISVGNKSYGWKRTDGKLHYIYGGADAIALFSDVSNKPAWQYTPSTDTFNVHAANTNLVTKTKDGRATPTLTADAELFTPNAVIADRRGNTVTMRAPVRRKAGSTNLAVLFTMPVDMRPVITVQQGICAIDGTIATFTVATDGNVTIQDATGTSVAGKNFFVMCTYVVD